MESDIVLVEVDAGVATVTLNRPEQRNAINLQLSRELPTAMWAADADDAVRVIILTGAGDAFCAGADLSEAASGVSPDRLDEYGYSSRDGHGSTDRFLSSFAWWRMRTPVVAAINGAAIGGGLTLALGADLRFAAADATLALPFTRMGVTPEGTATWLLPRLIGPARAAELLLSGRPFTGAEAAAMGIVNEAVARAEVVARAREFGRQVAVDTAPHAVAATKHLLHLNLGCADREEAFRTESRFVAWAVQQPDMIEGATAMLERRAPAWTGSKHAPFPAPPEGGRPDGAPSRSPLGEPGP